MDLKKYKLDVLGVQETRLEEQEIDLGDHKLFLTDSWLSTAKARQGGVGIAVTKRLAGSLIEQVAMSEFANRSQSPDDILDHEILVGSLSNQLSPASSTSSFHEYSHLWNDPADDLQNNNISIRTAFEKILSEIQQDRAVTKPSPLLPRRFGIKQNSANNDVNGKQTSSQKAGLKNLTLGLLGGQNSAPGSDGNIGKSQSPKSPRKASPARPLSESKFYRTDVVRVGPTAVQSPSSDKGGLVKNWNSVDSTSESETETSNRPQKKNSVISRAKNFNSSGGRHQPEDENNAQSGGSQRAQGPPASPALGDRKGKGSESPTQENKSSRLQRLKSPGSPSLQRMTSNIKGRLRRNQTIKERKASEGRTRKISVPDMSSGSGTVETDLDSESRSTVTGATARPGFPPGLKVPPSAGSSTASLIPSLHQSSLFQKARASTSDLRQPDKSDSKDDLFDSDEYEDGDVINSSDTASPMMPPKVDVQPVQPIVPLSQDDPFSVSNGMDMLSAEDKLLIKRKNIVCEIYTNEENYTEHLARLADLGKEIDSMRKKEDVHTMLRKVIERALQIQKCHTHETRLKVSLDRRVLEWDKNQIVSEPIIASFGHSSMREAYTKFVLEHSKVQPVLKAARANNQVFDAFLNRFEDRYPDKLTVEALLMKPVQKMPQLILLLQRLLSSCDTKHPDRQGLQTAVMTVEQLAHDLNGMKGHHDLIKQVESLREQFARTHKNTVVEATIPKESVGQCARKDEVRITMVTPDSYTLTEGYVLLFPRRILLLAKIRELRGERVVSVLSGEIERARCIGHEIFFKAGMCDSVDPELKEDYKLVTQDEKTLLNIKQEIEEGLNREYRDLNSSHIALALKENQAVSRDVIQSVRVAGCVDVFFSSEPDSTETDVINDLRPASTLALSQWKLTFGSKEEAGSFKITLKMMQMALCSPMLKPVQAFLSSPLLTRSGGSNSSKADSMEQTMHKSSTASVHSPGMSPTSKKFSVALEGSTGMGGNRSPLTGCWIRTDSEKGRQEKYLSVPLLHSVTKVQEPRSALTESFKSHFDDEEAKVVCSLPLSNSPNICPLALDNKQIYNFEEKPHAEVMLCFGVLWVVHSNSSAFLVSVYSICENGVIHNLTGGMQTPIGDKAEAFCAVAVPGLDVDDSVQTWQEQQQNNSNSKQPNAEDSPQLRDALGKGAKSGNVKEQVPKKRPRVLKEQSVWIGTSTGIVVYKVIAKVGIGQRAFRLPTKHGVMSIAYANGHVVAGLENGFINIYSRSMELSSYAVWNSHAVVIDMNASLAQSQIRRGSQPNARHASSSSSSGSERERKLSGASEEYESLGSVSQGPVTSIILPFNDCLKSVADPDQVVDIAWCSIAHQIFIISIVSRKILYKIELQLLQVVSSMASVGVCVFVACKSNRNLEIYHAETYQTLSIINLDKSINAFLRYTGMKENTPKQRLLDQEKFAARRGSAGGVNVGRASSQMSGLYPSAMAVHSGSLWIGTSGGHLIRFETSKIGLIPNIREPKTCVFHFKDQPVTSIIFTGKKYQAAYQRVVMNEPGVNNRSAALEPKDRRGKKRLDGRKCSIVETRDYRSVSSSDWYLNMEPGSSSLLDVNADENSLMPSLGDVRRDRAPAVLNQDADGDEDDASRRTSTFASMRNDSEGVTNAFPMLTAKQDKSLSSNLIIPTYIMAIGERLEVAEAFPPSLSSSVGGVSGSVSSPTTSRQDSAYDQGASMITFQIV
ncbi:uncharacterized protein LOC142346136 [Convolutriloba macropyga]|uniref:uncharacterized protein LOC142346136 n=1 Tax=Convolutriloba macropyga TaxID=536237 RepID=UPI003F520019